MQSNQESYRYPISVINDVRMRVGDFYLVTQVMTMIHIYGNKYDIWKIGIN